MKAEDIEPDEPMNKEWEVAEKRKGSVKDQNERLSDTSLVNTTARDFRQNKADKR